MYTDTLELDISFDVPVRRPALFSRETFDVPVRPMDAEGLNEQNINPSSPGGSFIGQKMALTFPKPVF